MNSSNYLRFTLIFCILSLSKVFGDTIPLQKQLEGKINIVVAKDGSGNYTKVQDAINSVPDNSPLRTVVFIKKGTYFEKVNIPVTKSNLVMIGEDADSSVILYDDYSGRVVDGVTIGTSTSHSMIVYPENFLMMNLTIRNSNTTAQAVALNSKGDKQIYAHCRLIGYQDTYYTWGEGRYYLKDCFIEGATDYIFGRGAVVFDSCQVHSLKSGSYITAASTDYGWKFGYFFQNCRLTAAPGITGVYLGRPWKAYANTVFYKSYEGSFLNKAGWSIWQGNTNHTTCFYAEYDCFGPGSDTANRPEWTHQLTDEQAVQYTQANIFSANVSPSPFAANWIPAIENDSLYIIVKKNTVKFLDSTYYNANLLLLEYNEKAVPGFHKDSLDYSIETTDAVFPEIKAVSEDPYSVVTVTKPSALPGMATIKVTARDKSTQKIYKIAFTVPPSSIKENNKQLFQVTNPFSDFIRISSVGITGKYSFSLYNEAGVKLISKTNLKDEEKFIETAALPAGIYFYRIVFENRINTGKVVKIYSF